MKMNPANKPTCSKVFDNLVLVPKLFELAFFYRANGKAP